MHHDLGFFDDETCRLEPVADPFETKHKASAPEVAILTGTEREVARVHMPNREPADRRSNPRTASATSADQRAVAAAAQRALTKGR